MTVDLLHTFLFYAFAVVAVVLAIATVTTRRILRAAVYLMGVLTASAAFYVLLNAAFLAGVQVLVYVGGIAVLFIFAVMLTAETELLDDVPSTLRKTLAFAAAATLFSFTASLLAGSRFPVSQETAMVGDHTAALGRALLGRDSSGYLLPFELISLLLLAAVIGGIVLARKGPVTLEGGSPGPAAANGESGP